MSELSRPADSRFSLKALIRRMHAVRKLRKKFRKFDRTIYLGDRLKTEAKRRDYSLAYYEPDRALAEMHHYLWAVPAVPTPFVGEAPAPGRYGSAVINNQQLRHPVDIVVPKPRNVCRIFFTGASTAFCSGAPSEETTITGYLQEMLDRGTAVAGGRSCEVVNASYPGWASTYERLWIEMKLIQLAPDVVVHFSGNNDAHWGARHFPIDWMRSYHEQLFYLMAASWHRYFGKADIVDVVPRETGLISPERVARTLVLNVERVMHGLLAQKVSYMFILQPTIAETRKPLSDREARLRANDETVEYFSRCYREMRNTLQAGPGRRETPAGRPFFSYCDYSDIFDDCRRAQEVFLDPYHFGDRGNEIIAARLYRDLEAFI